MSLKNLKSTIYFVSQFCYNTPCGIRNTRLMFELKFIIPYFVMLVNTVKYVPVAQLDRVSDSDSEGRRFESCRAYQKEAVPNGRLHFGISVDENRKVRR